MRSSKRYKYAFTLAETMVIFAIIAVIATLAIKISKSKVDNVTKFMYYSSFMNLQTGVNELIGEGYKVWSDSESKPVTDTDNPKSLPKTWNDTVHSLGFCNRITELFNTVGTVNCSVAANEATNFATATPSFVTSNGAKYYISSVYLKETAAPCTNCKSNQTCLYYGDLTYNCHDNEDTPYEDALNLLYPQVETRTVYQVNHAAEFVCNSKGENQAMPPSPGVPNVSFLPTSYSNLDFYITESNYTAYPWEMFYWNYVGGWCWGGGDCFQQISGFYPNFEYYYGTYDKAAAINRTFVIPGISNVRLRCGSAYSRQSVIVGYNLYIDIDGKRGNSKLNEDVQKFLIYSDGTILPDENSKGATDKKYLSASVKNAAGVRIYTGVTYKEAICRAGKINRTKNPTYCTAYPVDTAKGCEDNTSTNTCSVLVNKPAY